ncbi:dethiobiotin synthase [Pelagibius sp. Alg239-R121]|uniref:dethiobiotin synthase n=1 Tax=Pelagibius sp. Alg239-R121 TaxID=2993448 RepID=UPI0024A65B72|nr:dethiobiotin synthase [Pelagibius sp. Alg239-R121]
MTAGFIVTGTDTGIGKTAFSAMLTQALNGSYFKPIQAGLEEETDKEAVSRLTGLPGSKILPETYRLNTPASPHVSAEIDGIEIDVERLVLPEIEGPLIVEGAGGLLVPVTRETLYIDVFASWSLPVILCARTALGAINHALLSLEALKSRGMTIHGIVFIGDSVPDTERTICEMGNVRRLGRLPRLAALNSASLAETFSQNFRSSDFFG